MPAKAVYLLLLALVLPTLPLTAGEVLSNQDILKMTSAGLGEDLIVTKIWQAPQVDFALESDELVTLQKAGVSGRVLQAMFGRQRNGAGSSPSPQSLGIYGMPANRLGIEVSLQSSDGTMPIAMLQGQMSTAGFMGFAKNYMNYPGLRATARTRDKRPSLLVKSSESPTAGRHFLAKLDPDDSVRSVKISSMGSDLKAAFGGGNMRRISEPDPSWTLPFDAIEESSGLWRVTFKNDLKPGEYGWYVDMQMGGQAALLFGFGVD